MSWINNNYKNHSKIDKFTYMGNLMFYPGNPINNRLFFFKTLLNENYSKIKEEESKVYSKLYKSRAKFIKEEGLSALNSSPLINNDNLEETVFFQRLNQAVKLLENGVAYERNNEIKYIQNKINEFKKVFDQKNKQDVEQMAVIEQLFAKLQSGTEIDYKAIINLINILNQGLKNTMAIYNKNIEHIQEVKTQYQKAKENYINQISGLDASGKNKYGINHASSKEREKRFEHAAQKIYINRKTFNTKTVKSRTAEILRSNLSNIKNVDSQISKFVTKIINDILNDSKKFSSIVGAVKLTAILQNSDYSPLEEEIKHAIITSALQTAKEHIAEILEDKIDYDKIIKEVELKVQSLNEQTFNTNITGYFNNFGMLGQKLDVFEESEQIGTNAKNLYDSVVNLISAAQSRNSSLTQEQKFTYKKLGLQSKENEFRKYIRLINELEQYAKQVKEDEQLEDKILSFSSTTDENGEKIKKTIDITFSVDKNGKLTITGDFLKTDLGKQLGFKSFNPTTLLGLISSLKKRASQQIRDKITKISKSKIKGYTKKEITKQLQQGLENIHVSIGGPKWSEIIVQIQETLKSGKIWTGPKNLKNDNIIITCYYDKNYEYDFSFPEEDILNMSEEIDKEIETLEEEYLQEYTKAIETDLQNFSKEKKYNKFDEYMKKFYSQENIRQEYIKKTKEKIQELNNLLENNEIDPEEYNKKISEQLGFLNKLENTLYISSTSKTYNNYMDEIGFIGGSVGQNITAQINNLNRLFAKGGMELTQEEKNWLIFAAINNSSLSIVGHKNQGIIESYLGSLAVFALFSESGAELEILKKMENPKDISSSDPNILHLYFVNGAYYPGSYVLQQALDQVKLILSDIQNVISGQISYKNGVQITSSISFQDIPNNESYKKKQEDLNESPWQTVSSSAQAKTQIHILFLAGLLGLIQSLNEQFNEIEWPT